MIAIIVLLKQMLGGDDVNDDDHDVCMRACVCACACVLADATIYSQKPDSEPSIGIELTRKN